MFHDKDKEATRSTWGRYELMRDMAFNQCYKLIEGHGMQTPSKASSLDVGVSVCGFREKPAFPEVGRN